MFFFGIFSKISRKNTFLSVFNVVQHANYDLLEICLTVCYVTLFCVTKNGFAGFSKTIKRRWKLGASKPGFLRSRNFQKNPEMIRKRLKCSYQFKLKNWKLR